MKGKNVLQDDLKENLHDLGMGKDSVTKQVTESSRYKEKD